MKKGLLEKLQSLTILYAEDEVGVRRNIADTLAYYVKDVFEASNGEDAYQLYKEKQPDIILSDIHMPKMDGIQLVKKIRHENTRIPIVMITAHTDKRYLLEAVELHMEKYLVKPIDLEQLLLALEKCVEHIDVSQNVMLEVDTNYKYDYNNKILTHKNVSIVLNKKEMQFFELLISNQNRIVPYEELQEKVWKDDVMTDSALRSLVSNLRKKLPTDIIYNLSGVGYKLV